MIFKFLRRQEFAHVRSLVSGIQLAGDMRARAPRRKASFLERETFFKSLFPSSGASQRFLFLFFPMISLNFYLPRASLAVYMPNQ